MAGSVYGIGAEGVVFLVFSEIGDDEVEMDGRCCFRERGIGVGDGGMEVFRGGCVGKGSFNSTIDDP